MIAKLTGIIDDKADGVIIIDVGGVGYVVQVPAGVLTETGAKGAAISLAIETEMRDSSITLYGFTDNDSRTMFRLLMTVQGVGAKVALALLSTLPLGTLRMALAAGDVVTLGRAPGVGRRLAQRLVGELTERMAKNPLVAGSDPGAVGGSTPQSGPMDDAVAALVTLGYSRAEAVAGVSKSMRAMKGNPPADDLIRASLRNLAQP